MLEHVQKFLRVAMWVVLMNPSTKCYADIMKPTEIKRSSQIGSVQAAFYKEHKGKQLNVDSFISRFLTKAVSKCRLHCLENSLCMSINVKPEQSTGNFWCELLESDKFREPKKYVDAPTSIHYSINTNCSNSPPLCVNKGECIPDYQNNTYNCKCVHPYSGRHCEKGCSVKTLKGQCCVFPFSYNGNTYHSCTRSGSQKLWCSLSSNYNKYRTWGTCDVVLACSRAPCQNGGTCIDNLADFSYNCACPQGLTGTNCESGVNECLGNPCFNNGTCVDKFRGFECKCSDSHAGQLCQYDIQFACDSSNGLFDMTCPSENAINIAWAKYGRSSLTVCPHSLATANCGDSTINSATSYVRTRCQGKTSCQFTMNEYTTGQADPCRGIFKYLEIHWNCTNSK